jgi:hypothetical protein
MSRNFNDSTTCFQGRDFSSNKPHILDPDGSATTPIQKLAVPEQLLQVPHFNFLFNDSIISPVGSGLQNTEAAPARPQGWLEEEILISNEKTKFDPKCENFTVIIDIPNFLWKKHAGKHEKNKKLWKIYTSKMQRWCFNWKKFRNHKWLKYD